MGVGPGGALHRAYDPVAWHWTHTDELLATVAELLDLNNRLQVAKSAKRKGDIPPPLEIIRPHQRGKSGRMKGTTMAEFAAMVKRDKVEHMELTDDS
jgi:hypothetical protein